MARAPTRHALRVTSDGRIVLDRPGRHRRSSPTRRSAAAPTSRPWSTTRMAVGRDGIGHRPGGRGRADGAARGCAWSRASPSTPEKLASRVVAIADGAQDRAGRRDASSPDRDSSTSRSCPGRSGRVVDPIEVARPSPRDRSRELDAPAEISATLPVTVIEPDVDHGRGVRGRSRRRAHGRRHHARRRRRRSCRSTRKKLRPWITLRDDRRRWLRARRRHDEAPDRCSKRPGQEDRQDGRSTRRSHDQRRSSPRVIAEQGRLQARRPGDRQPDRGAPGRPGDRHRDDRDPARSWPSPSPP